MDVDSYRLRHLITCLDRQGGNRALTDRALEKSGLTRTDADRSGVDPVKEANFIREACRALDDTAFAVKAGLSFQTSSTLTGYIGKYSKDLRRAIENSSRYYSAVDATYAYALTVSGNHASFEVECKDGTFRKYHRHKEFLLFGSLSRLREIAQVDFYPLEMRFDHERDASSAELIRKAAECSVVFGAERTEIILPLSVLELPIPTYDPALREHLTQLGQRLLREQPAENPSLRARVEGTLTANLPGRIVPADEVASNLGMSRRTFARRLKDEGVSFREIVSELRFDLAKTYLRDGLSITQIAFYLDYADTAAFSTAFSRWAGRPPSAFVES